MTKAATQIAAARNNPDFQRRAFQIATAQLENVLKRVQQGKRMPLSESTQKLIGETAFKHIEENILLRLQMAAPIVAILAEQGIAEHVNMATPQPGFALILREEHFDLFREIQKATSKPLQSGTLLHPCGCAGYEQQHEEVAHYQEILAGCGYKSKALRIPATTEAADLALLYVSPLP